MWFHKEFQFGKRRQGGGFPHSEDYLRSQHPWPWVTVYMGFSITSTVERVLAITELVDLICELSPRYGTTDWSIYSSYDNSSPGSSSYGALPVLARTTRFLSKRALRILWRRLDSFWPLLCLLPNDLLDVGESPSYLAEQDRHDYEVCSLFSNATRCL